MQAQLNKFVEWWNRFERGQKWRVIGITALSVVTLVLLIWFTTRPEYVPLMNDLDYGTQSQVGQLLAENGIISKDSTDGKSISVKQEDFVRAKQLIVSSDVMGNNAYGFVDVIANAGMGSTQTITRENLRQLYKSEVEQMLLGFRGIRSVTVVPNLPDDTSWLLTASRGASVAITVDSMNQLSRADGEAMAKLVSKSFASLDMKDIYIADSNFNTLYSGDSEESGVIDYQRESELATIAFVRDQIKSMLARLYDDAETITNFAFNWDKIITQSKDYSGPEADGSTGYIQSEISESSKVDGSTSDGAPGTDTNNLQTPEYNTGNGSNSSGSTKSRAVEYLYDEVVSTKESNVGTFLKDSSSLSVMAYKYQEYYEADVRAAGLLQDMTWKEYQRSIEDPKKLHVDEDIIASIKVGTGIDNVVMAAYERAVFISEEVQPVQTEQILMFILCLILIALLAFALFKKPSQDEVTEIEPELSVEELLVSTQLEEKREAEIEEMERLKEIEFNQDSEVKQQIEKFVTEKPEAVAQLLRNWLNDEWE